MGDIPDGAVARLAHAGPMIALKMTAVLAASLASALLTGALLRLAGIDVPEAATLVGACAGVGGVVAANLVRLREAGRAPALATVPARHPRRR